MRYGARNVSLAGATLSTIGSIGCAFSPFIGLFAFFLVVLHGVGRVTCMAIAIIQVQHYFQYNRGLATGLACIGYNVADFTGPLIISALMEHYGVSGMLLVYAGIQSHAIAFSLMYEGMRTDVKLSENTEHHKTSTQNTDITEQEQSTNEETFCGRINKTFDFSIVKSTVFVILVVLRVVWRVSKFALLTHSVNAAIHGGLSQQQAAVAMSLFGISSFISILYTTFFLNMSCVQPELYFTGGMCLLLVATMCAIVGTSYSPYGFYGSSFILGLGESMAFSSYLLVVVKLGGVRDFQKIYLYADSVSSLPAQLAASWFTGLLVDITGVYLPVFLLSMSAAVIALAMAAALVVLISRKAYKEKKLHVISVDLEPPNVNKTDSETNSNSEYCFKTGRCARIEVENIIKK